MRDGEAIGCVADARLERAALKTKLETLYPRVTAIECGPARIRRIAFCSGAGNSAVPELAAAGVDTLVTGELREEWFNRAQEERLNLYCCGHYATEVHAVKNLDLEISVGEAVGIVGSMGPHVADVSDAQVALLQTFANQAAIAAAV